MSHVSLDAAERNGVVSFITTVVAPAFSPFLRETWRGSEHVPSSGGLVVAANHLSYADPVVIGRFLLGDVHRLPHFLGKAEIFGVPVLGRLLRQAGQIPVHRGSSRARDSFAEAVEAVEAGRLVCLLPEGTLTRDPDYWPMEGKTGAVRIALVTGAPLVPVAMWGPERIVPPHVKPARWVLRALTRRSDVVVVAGPPVDLDDLRDREPDARVLAEATRRLMAAITDQLVQIRGEQPRTEPLVNPRIGSTSARCAR